MSVGASLVYDHFPGLTDFQKHQIEALGFQYPLWNEKINVISRKDIDELYLRHVLHSLSIAKFASFNPGTHIVDVGTGGGFPGIPLAILFPASQFLLVDSIGKKIKVVGEVASAIGLKNVEARHDRVENLKNRKFDFVVSRAVARAKVIYDWTKHLVRENDHPTLSNGLILLKGGDLKEELKELKMPHTIKSIPTYFDDPFFETKKIVYIPV